MHHMLKWSKSFCFLLSFYNVNFVVYSECTFNVYVTIISLHPHFSTAYIVFSISGQFCTLSLGIYITHYFSFLLLSFPLYSSFLYLLSIFLSNGTTSTFLLNSSKFHTSIFYPYKTFAVESLSSLTPINKNTNTTFW